MIKINDVRDGSTDASAVKNKNTGHNNHNVLKLIRYWDSALGCDTITQPKRADRMVSWVDWSKNRRIESGGKHLAVLVGIHAANHILGEAALEELS